MRRLDLTARRAGSRRGCGGLGGAGDDLPRPKSPAEVGFNALANPYPKTKPAAQIRPQGRQPPGAGAGVVKARGHDFVESLFPAAAPRVVSNPFTNPTLMIKCAAQIHSPNRGQPPGLGGRGGGRDGRRRWVITRSRPPHPKSILMSPNLTVIAPISSPSLCRRRRPVQFHLDVFCLSFR